MSSKSLSEQLAELANPVPTLHDPEDDIYEETRAQVTSGWEGGDDGSGDEEAAPSRLRQRAAALLPDLDPRYAGRAVSRKSLQAGSDGEESMDGSEDGGEDSDAPEGEEQEEQVSEEEDGEEEEEDQLEAFKARLNGVEAGTNGLGSTDEGEVETDSEEAVGSGTGQEDEDDEEDEEEEDAQEDSEDQQDSEAAQDEEEGEGESDEEGEDISAALDDDEEEGGVDLTSRSTGSDADKGAAVKAQLGVWDQLLECRIKLQPGVQHCAQLPAPGDSWDGFWAAAGDDTAARLADAAAAADRLLRQLMQLQDLLTEQFPETAKLASGGAAGPTPDADSDSDSDAEPTPATPSRASRKRRRASGLTASDPAKRFAAYRPYRDQTIQKWNDKTKLTAGKAASKSFAAFEQSTLRQIEQILSDRERLMRRTQLRRSDAARLGEAPIPAAAEGPEAAAGGEAGRDYDEERFDDSDFYHQLLRELIERKTVDVTDPLALGRQWIQIQKLRSKLKKRVDTRASKGRKVRYEVYPKLVNFMASQRAGSMTDAARDELFGSLFGSRCRPGDGASAAPAWTMMNGHSGDAFGELNGGPTV